MRSLPRIGWVTLCLASAATASTGCDGLFNRFSRDQAKDILEVTSAFSAVDAFSLAPGVMLEPGSGAFDGGIREGLWKATGQFPDFAISLTERGKRYFSAISIHPLYTETGQVVPLLPVRRRVNTVDGIKEVDKSTREVEFTWTFEGLTPVLERYSGYSAHTIWRGGAVFKLYDDGWRVEHLQVPSAAERFLPDEAAEKAANEEIAEAVIPRLLGAWEGNARSPTAFGTTPVKIVLRPGQERLLEGVVWYRSRADLCKVSMKLLNNELETFLFEAVSVEAVNVDGSCRASRYMRLLREDDVLTVAWFNIPPNHGRPAMVDATASLRPGFEDVNDREETRIP